VAEPQWDETAEWPWGSEDEVLHDRRAPGMGKRLLVRKGDLRAYPTVCAEFYFFKQPTSRGGVFA
jgi:hypothetical protein